MKSKLAYIAGFTVSIIVLYILVMPVFGQPFHTIGNGPIHDIEVDVNSNQIIVVSGHTIYIIQASDGQVVEEFQVQDINISDIKPGTPQTSFIYGLGGNSDGGVAFSINRTNNDVLTVILGSLMLPYEIVQDNERLFGVCHDQKLYEDEYSNIICVLSKASLTSLGTWPCEKWPFYSLYDIVNSLIIVGEGLPRPYGGPDEPDSPYAAGTKWMSKIGIYDTNRMGELVDEYIVEGSATGLAYAGDGALIVGLAGEKESGVAASTFGIISDPIEYIDVEYYHVVCMDYDTATDLEKAGSKVVMLPKNKWERIAL